MHFADDIRNLLIRQLVSPVKWEESIVNMIADGAATFVARTVWAPQKWDTYRAQLAYRLDLTGEKSLLKWLGVEDAHRLRRIQIPDQPAVLVPGDDAGRQGVAAAGALSQLPGLARGDAGQSGHHQRPASAITSATIRACNVDYAPPEFQQQRGVQLRVGPRRAGHLARPLQQRAHDDGPGGGGQERRHRQHQADHQDGRSRGPKPSPQRRPRGDAGHAGGQESIRSSAIRPRQEPCCSPPMA